MEVYLGTVELFAFGFAPRDWKLCDGTLLPTGQYQALFALIGTTYGGDGRNNFAIPDLRNASPIPNTKYYIRIQNGEFPQRQ